MSDNDPEIISKTRATILGAAILAVFLTCLAAVLIWFARFSIRSEPIQLPVNIADIDSELAQAITASVNKANSTGDATAMLDLAKLYHANKMNIQANEVYDSFLNERLSSVSAWYLKGVCNESLGDLSAASFCYEKCIALKTSYAPAYWRLALVKTEIGEPAEALTIIDNAITLAPSDLQIRLMKVKILLELDRPTQALELLENRSMAQAGNNGYQKFLQENCLRRLGRAVSQSNLTEEVTKPAWVDPWVAEISQFQTGLAAKRIRAGRYFRAGDYKTSTRLNREVIAEDKSDYRDAHRLAQGLAALGENKEAITAARRAVELQPNIYELHMFLAELLVTQAADSASEMNSETAKVLSKVIETWPDRWEAFDAMAQLSLLEDNKDAAIQWYDKACERLTEPGIPHVRRIYLLLEQQQWEKTQDRINELSEAYQNDTYIMLAQGRVFAGQSMLDDAKSCLSKINIKVGPSAFWKEAIKQLENKIKTAEFPSENLENVVQPKDEPKAA